MKKPLYKKIRDNTHAAVRELMASKRLTQRELKKGIDAWAKEHGLEDGIGLGTVNLFCQKGEGSDVVVRMIHDYLIETEPLHTSFVNPFEMSLDSHLGSTAHKLMTFLSPSDGFANASLRSFQGHYRMLRPSWVGGGQGHYLQSAVEILIKNGLAHFHEFQHYSFHGQDVKEQDEGFMIPHATNVLAVTRSPKCMKLFAIHDFFSPPDGVNPVQGFGGNLMAIAGKGPHPSYRFYCEEVAEPPLTGVFPRPTRKADRQLYERLERL